MANIDSPQFNDAVNALKNDGCPNLKSSTDLLYGLVTTNHGFSKLRIKSMEFDGILEEILWPKFGVESCSTSHLMLIVLLIIEKHKERLNVWECVEKNPQLFEFFWRHLLEKIISAKGNLVEESAMLGVLGICLKSLEYEVIKKSVKDICTPLSLTNLSERQRAHFFGEEVIIKKIYKKSLKKFEKNEEEKVKTTFDKSFFWFLCSKFVNVLKACDANMTIEMIRYLEKSLELFIDLESFLSTRRFFDPLLKASHIITYLTMSDLITTDEGSLICALVEKLKYFAKFEIDAIQGNPLTPKQIEQNHFKRFLQLQKAAFKLMKEECEDFYNLNVSSVDTKNALVNVFSKVGSLKLSHFVEELGLIREDEINSFSDEFLIDKIVFHAQRRQNQLQQLNDTPLYPNEEYIWDENLIPYDEYTGDSVLPLDKLNLQFLTLNDYLVRNYNLFKLESTYEIRQELEDCLYRMKPYKNELHEKPLFEGWSKKALPINSSKIVLIDKARVGEKSPACVKAEIVFNVPQNQNSRRDWDKLRRHDICLLVTVRPKKSNGFERGDTFKDALEIINVRGCEIEGFVDSNGRVIEEYEVEEFKKKLHGFTRTVKVILDSNQYRIDAQKKTTDLYDKFDVIVRRDAKANNFKAVLDTIRQLLNTECVVPNWLGDLILGYGDPSCAGYKQIGSAIPEIDFCDTFLNKQHVLDSFPDNKVEFTNEHIENGSYTLKFSELEMQHGKETNGDTTIYATSIENNISEELFSQTIRRNTIRFTPAQVEAIKSGVQPGLTMIVGPPGTGKTDVAVQIISNIYKNWPNQRTLIVTHSNQALNQLFEKIMGLDIDERHLLRLGHGEDSLETTKDFSRYGRVKYVLEERIALLAEVGKIRTSLDIVGDYEYSCEMANHLYIIELSKRWRSFMANVDESKIDYVKQNFPFTKYFSPQIMDKITGENVKEDLKVAIACWDQISHLFEKLKEYCAFELLRSGKDRTEYLLVKEAKIIAMTCTHAALKRKDLVELGFSYDNVLMEESAQILEVETFIPLLLQNPREGKNRLKRWIMIGDHYQLPPVVQNMSIQKYCNMEQSLFTRFVRLGIPTIDLDQQGRTREDILQLYNWRYKNLSSLPLLSQLDEFKCMNAGFVHNFQFINIPNYNGQGESSPLPYFYQNLGEAEYAVALYTYMRILGYPAEKITILTTYNGQCALLKDVVAKRCANNPLLKAPHRISTVDKFQGQQEDYIILSLVKTENIGHLRDIRRLIVALSRARLGLYCLGRLSLFGKCLELQPSLKVFLSKPTKLELLPNELYPCTRQQNDTLPMTPLILEDTHDLCGYVNEFYKGNLPYLKQKYEEEMYVEKTEEEEIEQEEITPVEETEATPVIEEKVIEEVEEGIAFESVDAME
uniref:Pre-mRNA-splicing factor n=1 Tax=Rhabditophanes sp. KR3021 TaxID=114890 RepID=A0AC35UID5_9BILA